MCSHNKGARVSFSSRCSVIMVPSHPRASSVCLSLPLVLSLSPSLWDGLNQMRKFTPSKAAAATNRMIWVLTWQLSCSQRRRRSGWSLLTGRRHETAGQTPKSSAGGLDFRLTHGFSGQRRATGFRSENQQVTILPRVFMASGLVEKRLGTFGTSLEIWEGVSPVVLTVGWVSTVEQAATCCEC